MAAPNGLLDGRRSWDGIGWLSVASLGVLRWWVAMIGDGKRFLGCCQANGYGGDGGQRLNGFLGLKVVWR